MRSGATTFSIRRRRIGSEMVETRSKRRSSQRSVASAGLRAADPPTMPSSNAASVSKSCTCSQLRARASAAAASAPGAVSSVGATAITACG